MLILFLLLFSILHSCVVKLEISTDSSSKVSAATDSFLSSPVFFQKDLSEKMVQYCHFLKKVGKDNLLLPEQKERFWPMVFYFNELSNLIKVPGIDKKLCEFFEVLKIALFRSQVVIFFAAHANCFVSKKGRKDMGEFFLKYENDNAVIKFVEYVVFNFYDVDYLKKVLSNQRRVEFQDKHDQQTCLIQFIETTCSFKENKLSLEFIIQLIKEKKFKLADRQEVFLNVRAENDSNMIDAWSSFNRAQENKDDVDAKDSVDNFNKELDFLYRSLAPLFLTPDHFVFDSEKLSKLFEKNIDLMNKSSFQQFLTEDKDLLNKFLFLLTFPFCANSSRHLYSLTCDDSKGLFSYAWLVYRFFGKLLGKGDCLFNSKMIKKIQSCDSSAKYTLVKDRLFCDREKIEHNGVKFYMQYLLNEVANQAKGRPEKAKKPHEPDCCCLVQ